MPAHTVASRIPKYLSHYSVKQDPSLYTPMDHATWRFILKLSRDFFADTAHQKYLDGLEATGISIERIPLIQEMDTKLQRFDWRAVAVSGFIPPGVFMEFLSLGILPIACDMRSIEHLAYTPAPDIVHEAAGHAPIIADPEYRAYLRAYGDVSRHAITSWQDMDVYHAIRHLSDTKERPDATQAEIAAAQAQLDAAQSALTSDSEAALLSRMGWWTFEYGLIGGLGSPKIYGAGLLSSVGESYHCLGPSVRKIPFSIECIHQSYDITRPQPQLFVAPDFATLARGLEELAQQMAFRRGGLESLQKALQARTVTTTVLDSGVQVSGRLAQIETGADGQVVYLRWEGPVQLSHQDQEIAGHGTTRHSTGFSLCLGPGKQTESGIAFESGYHLRGQRSPASALPEYSITVWENCTVTDRMGRKIYAPEWGPLDHVQAGVSIPSVFGGAADRAQYLLSASDFQQPPGKPKTNLTAANRALNILYAEVRHAREADSVSPAQLQRWEQILEKDAPQDWLLRWELLELALAHGWEGAPRLRKQLERLALQQTQNREIITRGLKLL